MDKEYYDVLAKVRMERAEELLAEAIELRESINMSRREFSLHTGIPVRTLEDREAGRRTPPEYVPRLIAYQLKYEELVQKMDAGADESIESEDLNDRL